MSKLIIPNKEPLLKEKEALLIELKKYKKIFSEDNYTYLSRLLNLDESALVDKLSKEEQEVLSSVSVFDNINLFNVYHLCKNYPNNHTDVYVEETGDNLYMYHKGYGKGTLLFELSYDNTFMGRKQSVDLYNQLYDPNYYETIDEELSAKLDEEYQKVNPYDVVPGRYGGPASYWFSEHRDKINSLEKQLKDIRDRNIPTKEEKEAIELVQQYNQSLINYFGISDEGFVQVKEYNDRKDKKTLEKTINGFKVSKNIRYM